MENEDIKEKYRDIKRIIEYLYIEKHLTAEEYATIYSIIKNKL